MLLYQNTPGRIAFVLLDLTGAPALGIGPGDFTGSEVFVVKPNGDTETVALVLNTNLFEVNAVAAPGVYHVILPSSATSNTGSLQVTATSVANAFVTQALTFQVGATCAASFWLDSAYKVGPNVIRALFTDAPLVGSGDSTWRADVASNYVVTNPDGDVSTVTMASVVSDDFDTIDIYLGENVVPGIWTVAVDSTVRSTDFHPILNPRSWTFQVTEIDQEPLPKNAVNSETEEQLLKFLNPAYRNKPNWQAFIAGLAAGDEIVRQYAYDAFDQMWVSSASGKFLESRSADKGIAKPTNTGIQDERFRQLVLAVYNNKLTQPAFLQVLEIFYGPEATRGYAQTNLVEPFELEPDTFLRLLVDEIQTIDVWFDRNDFNILRRANALEVANIITHACVTAESDAYAVPWTDPETGETLVRIYSGSRGVKSSVRITLGNAQTALQFNTKLFPVGTALPEWTVTVNAGITRFAPNSYANYNLGQVVVGDYVVISGHEFSSINRGSWIITDIQFTVDQNTGAVDQWFEVELIGTDEVIQQCRVGSVEIYRAQKHTVYDNLTHVVVTQTLRTALVQMPVTTQIVERHEGTGTYIQNPLQWDIESLTRMPDGTVEVIIPGHELAIGDHFLIDDFVPQPAIPPVETGDASGAYIADFASGTSDTFVNSHWSHGTTFARALHKSVIDQDGHIWNLGGQTEASGTATIQTSADIFAITDSDIPYNYQWIRSPGILTVGLGIATSAADSDEHPNSVMVAGGYIGGPFAPSATMFENDTLVLRQNPFREEVLIPEQLSDTTGALGALMLSVLDLPISGTTFRVTDGTTTRIYGWGTGGDVTVAIGASVNAAMTNLAAAITGDGSADWDAKVVNIESISGLNSTVVIYEDAVLTSKSGLRAYGQAGPGAQLYVWATVSSVFPDYSADSVSQINLPNSLPAGGLAGFHRSILELADRELHYVIEDGAYQMWDAAGPAWTTTIEFTASTTVDNLNAGTADGSLVFTNNDNSVLTGGSIKLHEPIATVSKYDPTTNVWTDVTALKYARLQHQSIALSATTALVVGGRQPAARTLRDSLGIDAWEFDVWAPTDFIGPVDVARNSNTQLIGKQGTSVKCAGPMTASAGADQDALTELLLGDNYTVCGWMTNASGIVFYNGADSWATTADNTHLAFGIDANRFVLGWHTAAGAWLWKILSTPVDTVMTVVHSDSHPFFYHFAIVGERASTIINYQLYINGILIGTTSGLRSDAGTDSLWVFANDLGTVQATTAFNGALDSIGVVDASLTESQVRQLYLNECGYVYDRPDNLDYYSVGKCLATCEVINTSTGFLRLVGSMTTARFAFGMVQIPDGRIIVMGGIGHNQNTIPTTSQRHNELNTVEIYDPELENWTPLPSMLESHSYCATGYHAGTNRIYISGGFTSKKVEYLDLNTMRWGVTNDELNVVRARAAGGLTGDVLLLSGGDTISLTGTVSTSAVDNHLGIASDITYSGGINSEQVVLDVDGDAITFETPNYLGYTSGETGVVTAIAAQPGEFKGPFILDPVAASIYSTEGTLASALYANQKYAKINLGTDEALDFPDEDGWLIFNFGYSNQVGPVKYFGRFSNSALVIDAAFKFPQTLLPDSTVTWASKTAYVPADPETVGLFYLTASASGRLAAQQFIEEISASGIDLNFDLVYPGDRGLGGEGLPEIGNYKLSDKVIVWGSDDIDQELQNLRNQ